MTREVALSSGTSNFAQGRSEGKSGILRGAGLGSAQVRWWKYTGEKGAAQNGGTP